MRRPRPLVPAIADGGVLSNFPNTYFVRSRSRAVAFNAPEDGTVRVDVQQEADKVALKLLGG